MTKCATIEFKESDICIGDLKRPIQIISHTITPPMLENPEYTIDQEDIIKRWAAVKTFPNVAVFDTANTEQTVSHDFYVRYSSLITSEHWILFKGLRFNIVLTENLQERDEYLRLRCNIRGNNT